MSKQEFDRLVVEDALEGAAAFFLAVDAISRALISDSGYYGDPQALRAISDAGYERVRTVQSQIFGDHYPDMRKEAEKGDAA